MVRLFGAAPSLSRRFLRDLYAPFWRQAGGSRGAALAAHNRSGRVYATLLWRWLAITAAPVALSTMRFAHWFRSRGRLGRFWP